MFAKGFMSGAEFGQSMLYGRRNEELILVKRKHGESIRMTGNPQAAPGERLCVVFTSRLCAVTHSVIPDRAQAALRWPSRLAVAIPMEMGSTVDIDAGLQRRRAT